jgi:hypothetical protein
MAKIGIVGGGIAGLYCAWKLLKENNEVALYECLDRLGGRIETQDLHGFKAECGPMRFELEIEPYFRGLTQELKIEFANFTPPVSGMSEFPKYDLQSNEVSSDHKLAATKAIRGGLDAKTAYGMHSHHTSALDLLKYGIFRIFHRTSNDLSLNLEQVVAGGAQSKISQYAGTLKDGDYDYIRTKQEIDGVLLYTLGFWNALSRVLSPGAIAKIRETGTFYHLLPENPSASEWSIFWLRLFHPKAALSTIKSGVETNCKAS